MTFGSDTSAPAHPRILEALIAANQDPAPSYGADDWTTLARRRLEEVFETSLGVWLVPSGTAANALGLSLLCPPTGSILCHEEAHIERDERGAPEFFSGGGRLSLLPGPDARIDLVALRRRLKADRPDFVHETPAKVLSISNLTECGAALTAQEMQAYCGLARAAGLSVHLDGARFANAVAAIGASPADLSWRAGVDVMSFGATKNGAAGCEAILLFGDARRLEADLAARAKRSGHMPPKMRFMGAQMAAYLEDGLWLDLARNANRFARQLADLLVAHGGRLAHPVDGNEVFVVMAPEMAVRLSSAGVVFHPWPDGSQRFVCSWATSAADVNAVAEALAHK